MDKFFTTLLIMSFILLDLCIPNADWTIIYPGLIFDYSLPNLREYDSITTYGDLDVPFPVTSCSDIGRVTALAALDERTINKGVQITGTGSSLEVYQNDNFLTASSKLFIAIHSVVDS